MVFEGGGAKGSVFAGALEVFYAAGHTSARLVGTSAGAITAAFVAAGYKPDEMLEAVNEKQNGKPRFASFMDMPAAEEFDPELRTTCQLAKIMHAVDIPFVPGWLENQLDEKLIGVLLQASPHFRQIFSFVECGGLYSGTAFCEWLTEKLKVKGLQPGCTLADMHASKGCDLSLVVTDTTNREMLVLNHRTAPGVPIVMAVRMSMSIPFVWREVEWKSAWGTYLGQDKTGAKIVDGGVLSNFAVDLVATDNVRARKFMGESTDPTKALNLGLLIDETLPVPGVQGQPNREKKFATTRRVQRLVDTMTGARDNALIREYDAQICRLPAGGYGTTEFDMAEEKLNALVNAGREAMQKHLAGRTDF
jgi:predicted acylesterase/phospholipase RssA